MLIKELNDLKKKGYSFNREYCGQPIKRIVVRFMGDWVSHHGNFSDASLSAQKHDESRQIQMRGFGVISKIIAKHK